MNKHIREILEAHDDPDTWEFPLEFCYETAERRFLRAVEVFDREFELEYETVFGLEIQNATLFGDIFIGEGNPRPIIRFSNYGRLFTVGFPELLDQSTLSKIVELLCALDFIFLPADELMEPYDGVFPIEDEWEDPVEFEEAEVTWFDRFFSWV